MSYTKHTWTDGELVTAAKMNNIENGIEEASSGGGVLVVHDELGTLDKTWQEIADAVATTGAALVRKAGDRVSVAQTATSCVEELLGGFILKFGERNTYRASSASDYPTQTQQGNQS